MQPTHIFTNGCSFLTQRPKEGVDTHVGMELAKLMDLETACHLGGGGRGNKRCSITTKVWCEKNKEIAEKLNISPSTVSRIVRNKYLQLPDKVIQLRELLEKRINKLNSGRDVTTEDLKFLLEQMVLNEDDSNPLSDENIKSALEENFEVYVSRRTIAKYRLELDIPSSKQRYLR